MTRNHFEPYITSSVCVAQVMGNYNCKIVPDDDHGHVFYVKLPLPEDAARFHGHSWVWWNEYEIMRYSTASRSSSSMRPNLSFLRLAVHICCYS